MSEIPREREELIKAIQASHDESGYCPKEMYDKYFRRTTNQEDLANQANLSEIFNSEGQENLKECEEGTLTKLTYVEPADYIPKEIRTKYKLGEYADDEG